MGSSSDEMKKLVTDEISVLRQENTERDNKFQTALDKIAESFEDHVWFEDRWMVASLCDE
jgi:hemerythrin